MEQKRKNIKDIWNLNLTDENWINDFPAYTSTQTVPSNVISLENAILIYKAHIKKKLTNFSINAYVDFTTSDINKHSKYDVWRHKNFIFKVTSHFDGIIAPYYACEYTKRHIRHNYNLYKMHAMSKYASNLGQNVINNYVSFNYTNPTSNYNSLMMNKNSIIYIDIRYYKRYDNSLINTNDLENIKNINPRLIILVGNKDNPKRYKIESLGLKCIFFEDSKIYDFVKTEWQLLEENDKIFDNDGYPICIPKSQSIPKKLISWSEAIRIYKKEILNNPNFKIDAYVHFYVDDQVFDGPIKGVWYNPKNAIKVLIHFKGIITVDYSTYHDFPTLIKQFSIYKMLLSGILANKIGIEVINNLRLDLFDAYPSNYIKGDSIIAIGTVASKLKTAFYRSIFTDLYSKYFEHHMVDVIITLGSANYEPLKKLKLAGVKIVSFKTQKNLVFERGEDHV